MEVAPLARSLNAADFPLEKLATSTQLSDAEKISEISRQFESVLLRQILSEAQKPLFKSALLRSDSCTNSIYQDIIVEQLADRISRGGTFGFAKVLEHQLSAQYIHGNHDAEAEPVTHASHSGNAQSPHAIRDQEGQRKKKDSHSNNEQLEPSAKPFRKPRLHGHQDPLNSPALSHSQPHLLTRPNAISDPRMIPATHPPSTEKRDAHRTRKHEPQPGKRI
jgi:Rod binding domain-containing protein